MATATRFTGLRLSDEDRTALKKMQTGRTRMSARASARSDAAAARSRLQRNGHSGIGRHLSTWDGARRQALPRPILHSRHLPRVQLSLPLPLLPHATPVWQLLVRAAFVACLCGSDGRARGLRRWPALARRRPQAAAPQESRTSRAYAL